MSKLRSHTIPPVLTALLLATAVPSFGNLIITPRFDTTNGDPGSTSIASDPNAAAIEATIIYAINIYEATFTNPINVSINFQENPDVLGQSQFSLYSYTYGVFHSHLIAATSHDTDDTAALAELAALPPVSDNSNIYIKSANAKAIGLTPPPFGGFNTPDGTITLQSGGTPISVVEHEIDEVLGLGSTLGLSGTGLISSQRSPEDFFRFNNAGARSFTTSSDVQAYFSINGVSLLDQFDNSGDGGDYGDWQSNPLPSGVAAQVQDAFSTGANPALGVELRALDVIGYTLAPNAPEPSTVLLMTAGLGLVAFRRKLRF